MKFEDEFESLKEDMITPFQNGKYNKSF